MKKKIFITIIAMLFAFFFSISYCFAENAGQTAVDGIRNVVSGAENIVENAAGGVVNGVRNTTHAAQNTVENMTTKDNDQTAGTLMSDNNNKGNNGYSATRTTTRAMQDTTGDGTLFGMDGRTWSWIIMALLGIATIALIWTYAKQHDGNAKHSNHN